MSSSESLVCLDVGEKRIGVAVADSSVRIAVPLLTIAVDGDEIRTIAEIVSRENAKKIIVGYPRNQQGETTAQSAYVEAFSSRLEDIGEVVFQDESLTSVLAESRLKDSGKPYKKEEIDAMAAAIILQDYLETYP